MKDKVAETGNGYSFEIIEGSCETEDCEGVMVFGIAMTRNGGKVAKVDDISSMRSVVEKLLELCDRNEVLPESLPEVIEDYLE